MPGPQGIKKQMARASASPLIDAAMPVKKMFAPPASESGTGNPQASPVCPVKREVWMTPGKAKEWLSILEWYADVDNIEGSGNTQNMIFEPDTRSRDQLPRARHSLYKRSLKEPDDIRAVEGFARGDRSKLTIYRDPRYDNYYTNETIYKLQETVQGRSKDHMKERAEYVASRFKITAQVQRKGQRGIAAASVTANPASNAGRQPSTGNSTGRAILGTSVRVRKPSAGAKLKPRKRTAHNATNPSRLSQS